MSLCEHPLLPEQEAVILGPYTYLLPHTKRHIGPKLIQAFNYWFQIPQDKQEIINSVGEMVNNGSLLIDDIEDNSRLRRGIPVAHHVYGIPLTINAANYLYFLALEKIVYGFPGDLLSAGVRIFTEQLLQMHQGQGVEIYWREALICPTEEQYLDMIEKKTGIICMVVRLMQLFSEDKRDFSNLINLIGAYFQISNDYENLKSKKYAEYKSFADDITEGKFSFPIIHAIRNSADDQSIINILKKRTENVEMKKYAVSQIEELGSLEYTHKVMNEYLEEIVKEVEKFGGNPFLKVLIEYLKEQQV